MKIVDRILWKPREPCQGWPRETFEEEVAKACIFFLFGEVVLTHSYVKSGQAIDRVCITKVRWDTEFVGRSDHGIGYPFGEEVSLCGGKDAFDIWCLHHDLMDLGMDILQGET